MLVILECRRGVYVCCQFFSQVMLIKLVLKLLLGPYSVVPAFVSALGMKLPVDDCKIIFMKWICF